MFWEMVGKGQVSKVEYCRDRTAVMVTEKKSGKTHRVMLPFDPDLFEHLVSSGVEVDVLEPTVWSMMSEGLANTIVPVAALVSLVILFMRSIGEPPDDLSTPLAKRVRTGKIETTLQDVAGIDSIREEIEELIDYLRDADRYLRLGARLPAGVLMVGPPGTGKTLLAKAIAGEAKVPFFCAAGSEFVEMYVGVGASRVRNLFAMARKAAPCIIFIDEFDALGASRTLGGMGGPGSEESANTINQMLTEMDGFEDNRGIVMLAATNRPAILDEALTRPGRFDRVLHLPLPGVQGRVQILKVHARDKQMSPDVDWDKIARGCAGWTGADIMNLMNESAIATIRDGKEVVEESYIVDALEKLKRDALSTGGQKVERAGGKASDLAELPETLKESICVHEAGRALAGHLIPFYDDLQKVTVFPNGRPTGFTSFIPQEDHLESGILTRGYLESQIVVCIAGRVAERLLLGDKRISTAATGYLADANLIARQMVMRFGFNKTLGPVSYMGGTEEVFLHSDQARVAVAEMPADVGQRVLSEVGDIIEQAEAKAATALGTNLPVLRAIADHLAKEHSMSGKELAQMCDKMGTKPFMDVDTKDFEWDNMGRLIYPKFDGAEGPPEMYQKSL